MTAPLAACAAQLGHVAVPCRDLAASTEFYQCLGFKAGFAKSDPEGRPILQQMRLEAFFVELLLTEAPLSPGDGHIGLKVDDADRVHARLAACNLSPDQPRTGVSGVRYFFLTDPDGNRIEITS